MSGSGVIRRGVRSRSDAEAATAVVVEGTVLPVRRNRRRLESQSVQPPVVIAPPEAESDVEAGDPRGGPGSDSDVNQIQAQSAAAGRVHQAVEPSDGGPSVSDVLSGALRALVDEMRRDRATGKKRSRAAAGEDEVDGKNSTRTRRDHADSSDEGDSEERVVLMTARQLASATRKIADLSLIHI